MCFWSKLPFFRWLYKYGRSEYYWVERQNIIIWCRNQKDVVKRSLRLFQNCYHDIEIYKITISLYFARGWERNEELNWLNDYDIETNQEIRVNQVERVKRIDEKRYLNEYQREI